MAAVVVALVALGLSGCVADPPPIMGTATPGNAQAVVSWQPPLAAPAPIAAYVVTPWIGSARQTPVVFNSAATTQIVTGLTPGVAYTFTVHAVNAHGDSAESGMSNPVTPTARQMFGWGDNFSGQLGDGFVARRVTPTQVGTATGWASVAAGGVLGAAGHTVAVKTNGTLWAWGENAYGQLGDGTTTSHASPIQVGTATNWASVAAGNHHTVAVKTDGTLWAWGRNAEAQLGDGTITNRSSPVQIGTATNWASVAAGSYQTAAIKTDGTLWAWGETRYGQLGACGVDGCFSTSFTTSPAPVGVGQNWVRVAAGGAHTIAIATS